MGTNDQDNESPQPSNESSRDFELTNESLVGNDNGNGDAQDASANGGVENPAAQRPKRMIKRRKIRVELIKDSANDRREDGTEEESPAVAAEAPAAAPAPAPAPEPRRESQRPSNGIPAGESTSVKSA